MNCHSSEAISKFPILDTQVYNQRFGVGATLKDQKALNPFKGGCCDNELSFSQSH